MHITQFDLMQFIWHGENHFSMYFLLYESAVLGIEPLKTIWCDDALKHFNTE